MVQDPSKNPLDEEGVLSEETTTPSKLAPFLPTKSPSEELLASLGRQLNDAASTVSSFGTQVSSTSRLILDASAPLVKLPNVMESLVFPGVHGTSADPFMPRVDVPTEDESTTSTAEPLPVAIAPSNVKDFGTPQTTTSPTTTPPLVEPTMSTESDLVDVRKFNTATDAIKEFGDQISWTGRLLAELGTTLLDVKNEVQDIDINTPGTVLPKPIVNEPTTSTPSRTGGLSPVIPPFVPIKDHPVVPQPPTSGIPVPGDLPPAVPTPVVPTPVPPSEMTPPTTPIPFSIPYRANTVPLPVSPPTNAPEFNVPEIPRPIPQIPAKLVPELGPAALPYQGPSRTGFATQPGGINQQWSALDKQTTDAPHMGLPQPADHSTGVISATALLAQKLNAHAQTINNNTSAIQNGSTVFTRQMASTAKSTLTGGGGSAGRGGNFGAGDQNSWGFFDSSKLETFGTAVKSLSINMNTVFRQTSSGILDLVAAADPAMFLTFNNSVTALAIQVGTVFVPYVEMAARSLQEWAEWFKTSPDWMKNTIGYVGIATVAITALGAAVRLLSPAFSVLTGAWRVLSAAFAVSPLGVLALGIAAVATAVYGLSTAWGETAKNAKDASGAMGGAQGAGVPGGPPKPEKPQTLFELMKKLPPDVEARLRPQGVGRVSDKEIKEKIPNVVEQLQTEQSQKMKVLQEKQFPVTLKEKEITDLRIKVMSAAEIEVREIYEKLLDQQNRELGINFPTLTSNKAREYQTAIDTVREKAFQEFKQAGADVPREEIKDLLYSTYTRDKGLNIMPPRLEREKVEETTAGLKLSENIKQTESTIALLQQIQKMAVPDADKFKQDYKSPVQARYTDPLSLRDNIQMQALNVGELAAQNAQEQMRNMNERLEKTNGKLADIDDGIAKMLELPFMFWR